jgi:hypothetical protein
VPLPFVHITRRSGRAIEIATKTTARAQLVRAQNSLFLGGAADGIAALALLAITGDGRCATSVPRICRLLLRPTITPVKLISDNTDKVRPRLDVEQPGDMVPGHCGYKSVLKHYRRVHIFHLGLLLAVLYRRLTFVFLSLMTRTQHFL